MDDLGHHQILRCESTAVERVFFDLVDSWDEAQAEAHEGLTFPKLS